MLVSSGFFSNAYAIDALDGFIYVSEEKKGIYVIKTYDDETNPFDPPVKVEFNTPEINSFRGLTIF